MADSVLSSEAKSKEHIRAFDDLAAARLDALETEKELVYMIDTVDADALPFLADQFNLLGLKGWNSAKTEQDKRDLIKRAIELNRYAGTTYSVRRALQAVGYAGVVLTEGGDGVHYDGFFDFDGSLSYGAGNWATFRATADLGESKGINDVDTEELIGLINTWKNARSKLVGLAYQASTSDTVESTDETSLSINLGIQEGVDTPDDSVTELALSQAAILENYSGLAEGNIDLSVKNSLGVEINHYIF